jgi:hypothetical protein
VIDEPEELAIDPAFLQANKALIKRVAAVEATIQRFDGRPLQYGRDDCVRMVAFGLRKQGVKVSLLGGGRYSSALGAVKALKRAGYSDLVAAVDGQGLNQIAPAAALPGDVLALPAEQFGGALFLAVGNGRAFGYFDGRFQVGQPHLFVTAWRSLSVPVDPLSFEPLMTEAHDG